MFRLEAILGDRPNIHPPAFFDLGTRGNGPTLGVERLIGVMRENMNEKEKEAEKVQGKGKEREQEEKGDKKCVKRVRKGEGSISGRKKKRNVEKERESDEEGNLRYISQYTVVSDRKDEVIQIEG